MMDTILDYTIPVPSLVLALVAGVLIILWLKPTKTETTVAKTDDRK